MQNDLHVIVVDDNKVNNFFVDDMLHDIEGIDKVEIYEDPLSALERLTLSLEQNEGLPNLLLLDINMPMMNGFELLEALEKHAMAPALEPLKVFIVTSSEHSKDIEEFERHPLALEFLNKPLNEKLLKEKIFTHFAA